MNSVKHVVARSQLLLLVIFIFSCTVSYSQDPAVPLTPAIVPPSPTVSELGRYGLIPVGLSTGTPDVNIPLYTFKTKNLELPLSLKYSSNGVKVDEIASWVGLQWSLNCGGMVSRIVRDDADDSTPWPYPASFSTSDARGILYLQEAGKAANSIDTEPDLFVFNFLGYTGKFVFDREGHVYGMPRNDLAIERTTGQGPGGFVITTPDGIRCTFEAAETSTLQAYYDQTFLPAVTAWYLTRIEHPLGDVIDLTYEETNYFYQLGITQSLAKNLQNASCGFTPEDCPYEISNVSMTGLHVLGKRLTKIESANYGSIEFQASKDRTDLYDYKLNTILVKDNEGTVFKEFSLSYIFSNNRGFTNSYISEFEVLKHRMFLSSVVEKDGSGKQERRHQFDYEDVDGLPSRLSFAQDHWGYFNGVDNYNFFPVNETVRDRTGELAFGGLGGDREPYHSFAEKGILKKITYPTGGYTEFTYQPNTYYTQKTVDPPVYGNVVTGGFRIAKIRNVDPLINKQEEINYYYARHDTLSLSSGRVAYPPDYYSTYVIWHKCDIVHTAYSTFVCPYGAMHSNSVNTTFRMNDNNIYYQYVTISRGPDMEAGVEEHEFSISFDEPAIMMWGSDYIKDSPLTNVGWDNGKEVAVRFYRKKDKFILLKETKNSYIKDERYHYEVPGLTVRRRFEPIEEKQAIYHCDASNINLEYIYWTCVAQHTHRLGTLWPWSGQTKCVASGNDNRWVNIGYHPCYHKAVGDTAVASYNLDHLDAVEYRNISDWVYLDKKTETTYDEDGLNPVISETQYHYDNMTCMLLSRTVTTTSEDQQQEVITKYPTDYAPEANGAIASLLEKYIINIPIKRETTLGGKQVDGQITLYNNKGQPTDIYQYEPAILKPPVDHNASTIVSSADYKIRRTLQYDPVTGNATKIQLTNNFSTVYLWSYDNTLPVAEVKNADMGGVPADYDATYKTSAEVTVSMPETPLWPTFEVFANQTITPSLYISPTGSNIPSSPLLNLVLRRADGSVAGGVYNGNWGDNTLPGIPLTPGVYQWFYSNGDIVFDENFKSYSFYITADYTARRTAYNVFYTSFEEDGIENQVSHTGRKVWAGTYNISLPGDNGAYKLTYWIKAGQDPWQFVEQPITVTSGTSAQMTIGNPTSYLDEVRIHPVAAQMTTYTYDPLVGVTSITDENNVTTYYEYDTFGRLALVRDAKLNIIRKYNYHYHD